MKIEKTQIVELLKAQGDHARAREADAGLPDPVDTEKDKGLLVELDLDPGVLVTKLSGAGGGFAGGLDGSRY